MENILENNKLIADFMGVKQHRFDGLTKIEKVLKYHTDWNWLMAVVEKIETMSNNDQFYIIVEYDNRDEFKGWIWRIDRFVKTLKVNDNRIKTKIEATYNACLEFIKWYNQNNK